MSTASYLLCNILGKQTDPNWKPDPVTVEMIAQTLAAAEERGRRAIRDRIIAILDRLPSGTVATEIRAALAPRDSGKEG